MTLLGDPPPVFTTFGPKIIPPKFTPISDIILKDKTYLAEGETPGLIISCGRKSVIPSILLKKKNPKVKSK